MADNITVNSTEETILVKEYDETIQVDGELVFVLQDVTETINVQIVNPEEVIIQDVSESIAVTSVEETLEVINTEEVLDFSSSEPVIINNSNYTIDTAGTIVPAGEAISGHRMVVLELGLVYHADYNTQSHQSQVLGMSLNAGVINDNINIITMGKVTEPSWSWTPDKPLFLSSNGFLTETRPVTGFLLQVAQSISGTEIWVDIKTPIFLG